MNKGTNWNFKSKSTCKSRQGVRKNSKHEMSMSINKFKSEKHYFSLLPWYIFNEIII